MVAKGPGSMAGDAGGLYPFESRFLEMNGLRYHYIDEGSGDTVVMLHGNPTWSFHFRNLITALRGEFRVIAPDHIGCGLSDKPGDDRYDYTLEQRVSDLGLLMTHLGITERVTLVVHDWGGMIGITWAVRNADAVQRLVVMNTGAFRLPKDKRFPWPLRMSRMPILGPFLVQGLNAFCLAAAHGCCSTLPLPREVREGYLKPYGTWEDRIAIHRFVKDIPLSEKDRSFKTLREVEGKLSLLADKPILLIWGERDFVFDGHFLDEWLRRFPKALVHRFKEGGHYILEDKKDEAITLIRSFLQDSAR